MRSRSAPIRRPARARIKARRQTQTSNNDVIETLHTTIHEGCTWIQDNCLYPFEIKKDSSVTPWWITIALTVCVFLLGYVPLLHGSKTFNDAVMTYQKAGTQMQIGTQPFVMAGMFYNLVFKDLNIKNKYTDTAKDSLCLGLLFSLGQCIQIAFKSNIIVAAQLTLMSFVMFNVINVSDVCEKVSLTTTLIVTQGALRIVKGGFYSNIVTLLCIIAFCVIHEMHIPVRLKHKKLRASTSVKLPLLYSGSTPMIVYYTLEEWFTHYSNIAIPFLFALPLIFSISYYWPQVTNRTGYDLQRQYAAEEYTLNGWRDASFTGKFFDMQVKKLTLLNSLILIAMVFVSTILNPSVSAGTLLIVVQTLKEHEPTHQLRQLTRRLQKSLKL